MALRRWRCVDGVVAMHDGMATVQPEHVEPARRDFSLKVKLNQQTFSLKVQLDAFHFTFLFFLRSARLDVLPAVFQVCGNVCVRDCVRVCTQST